TLRMRLQSAGSLAITLCRSCAVLEGSSTSSMMRSVISGSVAMWLMFLTTEFARAAFSCALIAVMSGLLGRSVWRGGLVNAESVGCVVGGDAWNGPTHPGRTTDDTRCYRPRSGRT